MKFYYISPVVNVGTPEEPEWDVKINQIPDLNVTAAIKIDPSTGLPLKSWALCIVAGRDHRAALADSSHFVLAKEWPKIGKFSTLKQDEQNRISNKFAQLGVSTAGLLGTDAWEAYLDRLGKACHPDFDVNNFDAVEPTA